MEAVDRYDSPLATRYATPAMVANFSDRRRALLWRDLWIALAEAERALGVPISDAQVAALRAARERIDFARVAEHEARLRHDVMAHIEHFGEVAGADAGKVIHLGATSCYVADNAELVMIRDGLEMLMDRLVAALDALARFAGQHRSLATLAYTHFQPAQLTTVGKRACLWAQDLGLDLETLEQLRARLPFRGVKGTTGTQASFLALFHGDHAKVRALDRAVAEAMGFAGSIAVSGQTYTRKIDTWWSRRWPTSPARRPRSRSTCGCSRTSERSTSRSRPIRSGRRRWPTSATRCGASGSAGSPGSCTRWRRARGRRTRTSGSSAPSMTARTAD
ncbi:lyase family protein [Nannocystis sp. RBIL2]|nr:lyase family protein [Nannocystis sp. RBIL2]MCY1068253.1 lyase family protein [Nannocystis sp. RBIL2]